MSTKIYNAFKVKNPAQVWPLLWKIQKKAREDIVQLLREHYTHLVRTMDFEDPEYVKARAESSSGSEALFRLNRAKTLVHDRYKTNVTRMDWDTYSLDVAVAVYPHKGEYYIRTFCEGGSIFRDILDFVQTMPELMDFHYQNSTDKPKEVSAKEWAHRRSTWNRILKNNPVGDHVVLDIFCWTNFYQIDPWLPLAHEWHKSPPRLPSREEVWAEALRKVSAFTQVTFSAGRITATPDVSIVKSGGLWISTIKGRKKKHKNLNVAGSHVEFEYLPESTKGLVRGLMAQAKADRRAKRAKK